MTTTSTFDLETTGPSTGARAIVLCPDIKGMRDGAQTRAADARLEEAVGLAQAIELEVVHAAVVSLVRVKSATLLGSGKVKEIARLVEAQEVELVVVDGELTPVQQRNLEKEWNAKVLDRTGLILEIFGARAQTREGTLQVELAHLSYQKGRLVRSWTHLERQRGGLGFVGGPGETQIEADRRVISERIDKIKKQLAKVSRTREVNRATRTKVPYPVVALVGYTNAGKSTLFNRLTGSGVMAEDMLFATLDPTMRAVTLPSGNQVILSDTVGFISNLPTQLIAAFRATLEEVLAAGVLIHVRDASSASSNAERADVLNVLGELGIGQNGQSDPRIMIEVLNKADLLDADVHATLRNTCSRAPEAAPMILASAMKGEGLDELLGAIDHALAKSHKVVDVELAVGEGEAIAWLHAHCDVMDVRSNDEGRTWLRVRITSGELGRFRKRFYQARIVSRDGPGEL